MNLYNFLKKHFFNKKTEKFIKTHLSLKAKLPLTNLELIRKKIKELQGSEDSPEKIITIYLLEQLEKTRKINYEKAKEEIRVLLKSKGFILDPVAFHKIFRAISYLLLKNISEA